MMNQWARLSTLLLGCMVSACTTLAPLPEQRNEQSALFCVQMRGNLIVGDQSQRIRIHWKRDDTQEQFDLSGAFGLGKQRVVVDHQGARLYDANNRPALTAASLDGLLEQRIGVPLPWSSLRLWLLGAPAPSIDYETLHKDASTHRFVQQDWQVTLGAIQAHRRSPLRVGTLRVENALALTGKPASTYMMLSVKVVDSSHSCKLSSIAAH